MNKYDSKFVTSFLNNQDPYGPMQKLCQLHCAREGTLMDIRQPYQVHTTN